MLTPIYLNLRDLINPLLDKPVLSSFELEDITKPTIGSSIYTLKIYPPKTSNEVDTAPFSSVEIRIPFIEPFKNKVRLLLQPSVGYGKNSCYKVEYFKYTSTYLAGGKLGRPKKEKCREEYWRVPAPDHTYLLNYEMWRAFKPSFNSLNTKVIKFIKGDENNQTLENNQDVILINSVKQSGVIFSNYVLTDTTLTDFESPICSLDFLTPPNLGEYEVEYVTPISHSELLFNDFKNQVLPPYRPSNAIYPIQYF